VLPVTDQLILRPFGNHPLIGNYGYFLHKTKYIHAHTLNIIEHNTLMPWLHLNCCLLVWSASTVSDFQYSLTNGQQNFKFFMNFVIIYFFKYLGWTLWWYVFATFVCSFLLYQILF